MHNGHVKPPFILHVYMDSYFLIPKASINTHSFHNNAPSPSPRAMDGHPVPVLVQSEETGNFELDEEALEEVLLNPRIADKYVCVLAVAGAFRKGKSFLLDFLLRYMSSQVRESQCVFLA